MDVENRHEEAEYESRLAGVARWIEIPIGIVLGLIAMVCAAGGMSMLLKPYYKSPAASFIVGVLILVFSGWCFIKTVRLVTGRPTHGGLMSPLALRILSVFFLMLPVVGIFTNYYRKNGVIAYLQAATYVVIFLALLRLARARQQRLSAAPPNSG